MTAQPWAYTHLSRRDAAGLVVLVALLHLWLLAGTPQWLIPASETPLQTQAFETRQIVKVTPVAAPTPAARTAPRQATSNPPLAQKPEPSTAPADATMVKPHEIEDLASQLTAPVALPDKVASSVDLPPFNRNAANEGVVEPTAFAPPPAALLKYNVLGKVKQLNYSASGELLWQPKAEGYTARLEIGAFLLGSRVQTSQGTLGPEGLSPTRFGDKTRSELAAHFQRDKGLISFSANTPDVPLLKGAQDRLSVVMQLSALLAADPQRFPAGTMLSFQTVSQREAEVWQFTVEKTEVLDLPYGNVSAIKLHRKPRREFDQQIEIWYAPDLQYLPVRLRITNANGDLVDQVLRGLDRNPS
jgi:hypothetical protein